MLANFLLLAFLLYKMTSFYLRTYFLELDSSLATTIWMHQIGSNYTIYVLHQFFINDKKQLRRKVKKIKLSCHMALPNWLISCDMDHYAILAYAPIRFPRLTIRPRLTRPNIVNCCEGPNIFFYSSSNTKIW